MDYILTSVVIKTPFGSSLCEWSFRRNKKKPDHWGSGF